MKLPSCGKSGVMSPEEEISENVCHFFWIFMARPFAYSSILAEACDVDRTISMLGMVSAAGA